MAQSTSHAEPVDLIGGDAKILAESHDEAFLFVSQGFIFEQSGRKDLACEMYGQAIERLDAALTLNCSHDAACFNKARKLQQKIQRSKAELEYRLQLLCGSLNHEEADNEIEDLVDSSTFCDSDQPGSSSAEKRGKQNLSCHFKPATKAEELFSIAEGVQRVQVSPHGNVRAFSDFVSFRIYKFEEEISLPERTFGRPIGWIQVGNWTYPLVPSVSPAFQAECGTYMFPDISSGEYGAAVGVILPESLSSQNRQTLQVLLRALTSLKINPLVLVEQFKTPDNQNIAACLRHSNTISKCLNTCSWTLSTQLAQGAEITRNFLKQGAIELKHYIKPVENPIIVDPKILRGMFVFKQTSGLVLKMSEFFALQVAELSFSLIQYIARSVGNSFAEFSQNSLLNDVRAIADSGIGAFSSVYLALEDAAKTLATSLADEAAGVAKHKFGNQVGELVENTAYGVRDVALTVNNFRSFKLKGIAQLVDNEAQQRVEKNERFSKRTSLRQKYKRILGANAGRNLWVRKSPRLHNASE